MLLCNVCSSQEEDAGQTDSLCSEAPHCSADHRHGRILIKKTHLNRQHRPHSASHSLVCCSSLSFVTAPVQQSAQAMRSGTVNNDNNNNTEHTQQQRREEGGGRKEEGTDIIGVHTSDVTTACYGDACCQRCNQTYTHTHNTHIPSQHTLTRRRRSAMKEADAVMLMMMVMIMMMMMMIEL